MNGKRKAPAVHLHRLDRGKVKLSTTKINKRNGHHKIHAFCQDRQQGQNNSHYQQLLQADRPINMD